MTYQEVMQKYEVVIGIETHVQLATKSKLFCTCDNDSRDAEPNTHICPVCMGLPGTLPVLNEEAVRLAIRTGLALNGQIAERTKFDRKNYFYPDLPKGYQITQFDQPIVGKGHLDIMVDGQPRKIGITRAHLEGDAGKLVHPAGVDYSLLDLNRAETPLLEIVSEPDMRSAAEAKAYAFELYLTARYARVSEANLYYGNMRFDVNVSLRKHGAKEFGTRTETKNLNSFRAIERAVEYEVIRQAKVLDEGGKIRQETRGWNDDKGQTYSMRSKEEADEYRYFPEPDLPPLVVAKQMQQAAGQDLITPTQVRGRLSKIGLSGKEVEVALDIPEVTMLFLDKAERSTDLAVEAQALIAQSFINDTDVRPILAEAQFSMFGQLAAAANATLAHEISATQFKEARTEIIHHGKSFESLGLKQVSDTAELEQVVKAVIAENPQALEDYRAGNARALGALIGAAMKATKGQGNPQVLTELIKQRLAEG